MNFSYNVRHDRLTKYYVPKNATCSKEGKDKKMENLTRGVYIGTVSEKNRKRIIFLTTYWVWVLSVHDRLLGRGNCHNLEFVTLTLPSSQFHSDCELKRNLLGLFLKKWGEQSNHGNYIWKAEKQKNGNLHFHLILDNSIQKSPALEIWNEVLRLNGYIDRYRENREKWHEKGFRVDEKFLPDFPENVQYGWYMKGIRENWENPNTVFVEKLTSVDGCAAYIAKYVGKNDSDLIVDGRVWGCSDRLRKIAAFSFDDSKYSFPTFSFLWAHLPEPHVINEYSAVFRMPDMFGLMANVGKMGQDFLRFCLTIYQEIR